MKRLIEWLIAVVVVVSMIVGVMYLINDYNERMVEHNAHYEDVYGREF